MINNILKKIEKANEVQKVELEKHEVHLGLADDIKKQANVLNTLIKNHGFAIQKKVVEDYNVKVNDIYKVAYNKLEENYNLISKQANLLKPMMERFIISSKELGVQEILNTPEFKRANELLSESDDELQIKNKLQTAIKK
jgi:hypothetical protein